MTKPLALLCLWPALLFAPVLASAADQSPGPMELVTITVDRVLEDMKSNEQVYEREAGALETMVNERVAPYFNLSAMARIATGQYWSQASDEQKEALTTAFKDLLIRSYARVMFSYRNARVALKGKERVQGRNAIVDLSVSMSGPPTDLSLRMIQGSGGWQVVDVVVDGVSILKTYRSSFASEIARSGIDGLIASLQQQNEEGGR